MKRTAFAALLISVCLASVCRSGDSGTVKIGVILSLSGELRKAGRVALAGVRLRLNDYNACRDPGQPALELVVHDDESNPGKAVQGVLRLAADAGVPAIIGPLSTNIMLAMRDSVNATGVVAISPSVTSPRIGRNRDLCCRLLFDDEFQGVVLARFLAQRQKMLNAAAILNQRYAYAASVFATFKAEFERLGGRIVAEERYEWPSPDSDEEYDFTDIIQAVGRSNPDVVLLPDHSGEVAAAIRCSTRLRAGLRFCGGDTWQHEEVMLSSGHDLENAFFVSGADFESGTPEMRKYIELFDLSNDPDAQLMSVLGYDALSLLIEAMKNGHDSVSIRDSLYSIRNFRLATGTITVDPEGGSEKTAYIHRINMYRGAFRSRVIDEIEP